jgi:hypothetical protein
MLFFCHTRAALRVKYSCAAGHVMGCVAPYLILSDPRFSHLRGYIADLLVRWSV